MDNPSPHPGGLKKNFNTTKEVEEAVVPEVNERFFVPASLWPDEKPNKTEHGKGWVASVLSVKKGKIVHFQCDGEDEPVSMPVGAFREHCKSLGMPP